MGFRKTYSHCGTSTSIGSPSKGQGSSPWMWHCKWSICAYLLSYVVNENFVFLIRCLSSLKFPLCILSHVEKDTWQMIKNMLPCSIERRNYQVWWNKPYCFVPTILSPKWISACQWTEWFIFDCSIHLNDRLVYWNGVSVFDTIKVHSGVTEMQYILQTFIIWGNSIS